MNNTYERQLTEFQYKQDLLVVSAVLMAPTVFGSTLILYCVCKYPGLRTKMNGLIVNLAIADLLVGLVVFPYNMAAILIPSINKGKITCLLKHSFYTTFIGASILNMFIISLERYSAVMSPLKYHINYSTKRLKRYCIAGWSTSVTLGILPLMGWNTWSLDQPCFSKCVLHEGYIALALSIYIPAIIITILQYILVIRKVFKYVIHKKTITEGTVRPSINDKNILKTKLMIIVFGIFAICWAPYALNTILQTYFLTKNAELGKLETYFGFLGVFNCAVNWIIYGVLNKRMKRAFKLALCCKCLNRRSLRNRNNSQMSTNVFTLQK